jgi:peroxiredoxin
MMRTSRLLWILLLPLVALLSNLIVHDLGHAGESIDVEWDQVHDVENAPLVVAETKWKIVCFLGSECPLARLYGKRLSQLNEEFSAYGVRVIGINSNSQDSTDDVKRYIAEHDVSFPIIKDNDQALARQFGATRTPEVFVLDASGQVRYQGRIDDQYEPGIARAAPTRHDLRDAIDTLTKGRVLLVTRTQAVGCLITIVDQPRHFPENASPMTFTRDIAPILNRHCVECHRPGEIGPFELTDYDEVVGWSEMMLEVIDQGRMPPWHADPKYGKFVGARHMPDEDRDTLAAWVAQGMPQGEAKDLPPKPKWVAGWQLSTPPDEEFSMRARPFVVPAEGTVEYQYFVVDPKWEEERWIRAAQVVPGNAAVVHHAIVFARAPDGSRSSGIGWLGGYVPGQRTMQLPPGHARRIPAGSKLVFQMHYTPNGRKTEDVTKVGVWFGEAEEITHEVTTRVALNHDFEIPPNIEDHAVELQMRGFARNSRLLSVTPHMHLRGKSFRLETRRDDQLETLLHVPKYDFNWQHWYYFESPLALDEVVALEMHVSFDNSKDNPANPNPEEFVTWGDQTWQEMAVAFFDVAHPRDQPRVMVQHENQKEAQDEAARETLVAQEVERFLAKMDRDGDGVVQRDEVPDAFRIFGFRRMDDNRDGRLERSEIEAQATRRL